MEFVLHKAGLVHSYLLYTRSMSFRHLPRNYWWLEYLYRYCTEQCREYSNCRWWPPTDKNFIRKLSPLSPETILKSHTMCEPLWPTTFCSGKSVTLFQPLVYVALLLEHTTLSLLDLSFTQLSPLFVHTASVWCTSLVWSPAYEQLYRPCCSGVLGLKALFFQRVFPS